MHRRLPLVLAALLVALSACAPGGDLSATVAWRPSHVVVLVLENQGPDTVTGSQAPYLHSLATRFGLATNFTVNARASQPNYWWIFAGSDQGFDDNDLHDLGGSTIADQLDAAGQTWQVAAENYPGGCFAGATASGGPDGPGEYVRWHNPAISFTSISHDPARCARITDLTHFDPAAADLSFVIPNECHNMHDCSISDGDAWVRGFVEPLLASDAMRDGVLFITWDEGAHGSDQVATIVVTPDDAQPRRSSVAYGHDDLHRTLQELLGLGCEGSSCASAPMVDLLPGGGATRG